MEKPKNKKDHAMLSPSSAHRWMNCPAAPMLEATVPDKSSTFAEEGTLAHALAALELCHRYGLKPDASALADMERLSDKYRSAEMDQHVEAYADMVGLRLAEARKTTPDARLLVEVRLDLSAWVPDCFGTSDAVILSDERLEVIDLKYGQGVAVSAQGNPQMMIYALGALDAYQCEYAPDNVAMTIFQPRRENCSTAWTSTRELRNWGVRTLRPKAILASRGDGSQIPGTWCQFCRVKNTCRSLAGQCIDFVDAYPEPKTMSNEDLGLHVLPMLATVKTWVAGLEDYALSEALAGRAPKGWKAVAGTARRAVTNEDGLIGRLNEAGYATSDYMNTKLKGIGDLEKLVGKKDFAAMADGCIDKKPGKPALVPDDDKRPAITAADDFKDCDI